MRTGPTLQSISALLFLLAVTPAVRVQSADAAGNATVSGALRVVVDRRIELMSIVCHLAGFEEYDRGRVTRWTAAVDSQFSSLREHEAVAILRRLRRERGISYDAPMSLAVHLEPDPGLSARLPFAPWPVKLDSRWTETEANAFLAALRDFARGGDFVRFWERQSDLRRVTAARLGALVRERDMTGWFDRWFGAKAGADFVLAAGLLNGGNCYGVAVRLPDGHEELWSVLGVWQVDDTGVPTFDARMLPTIVHEFAHAYANHLVDANAAALRHAGEAIFARVQTEMKRQAYGTWETMLRESLVRAASARWTAQVYSAEAGAQAVAQERERGFLWTADLCRLLEQYERDRVISPTLADFMPRIVGLFDDWAARIDDELAKIAAQREARLAELRAKGPKVVALVPPAGAIDVDAGLAAISITFDRPMQADRISIMNVEGAPFPPVAGKATFDMTRTMLTLPVQLAPGTTYGFGLNSESRLNMRDDAGTPLAPIEVRFSTRQ